MSLIVELGSARAGSCEVRRPLTRALLEIFSVAFSEQLKVLHHYGVFFFFYLVISLSNDNYFSHRQINLGAC